MQGIFPGIVKKHEELHPDSSSNNLNIDPPSNDSHTPGHQFNTGKNPV